MKKHLIYFSVLCTTLFFSCKDIIVTEPESNLNVEDFEAAWNRINDVYPYIEFKKIIGTQFIQSIARVLKMPGEMISILCFEIC